jgi:hypothetical protein
VAAVRSSVGGEGLEKARARPAGRVAITLDKASDMAIVLKEGEAGKTIIAAAYAAVEETALEFGISFTFESLHDQWRADYESLWQPACNSVAYMLKKVLRGASVQGVTRLFSVFQDDPRADAHPLDAAKVKVSVRLGVRASTPRLITPNLLKFLTSLQAQRSTLLFGRAETDPSFTDVLTYRLLEHIEAHPISNVETHRLKRAFKTAYELGETYEDPSALTTAERRPKGATCRCAIL